MGKVIVCFLSRFVILAYFSHLDVGGSPEEFAEVGEGGRVPQAGKGTVRVFSERQPENMCLPK